MTLGPKFKGEKEERNNTGCLELGINLQENPERVKMRNELVGSYELSCKSMSCGIHSEFTCTVCKNSLLTHSSEF